MRSFAIASMLVLALVSLGLGQTADCEGCSATQSGTSSIGSCGAAGISMSMTVNSTSGVCQFDDYEWCVGNCIASALRQWGDHSGGEVLQSGICINGVFAERKLSTPCFDSDGDGECDDDLDIGPEIRIGCGNDYVFEFTHACDGTDDGDPCYHDDSNDRSIFETVTCAPCDRW